MKFLMKLFRALNSGQTPWQITLAIVLGMIAGLTPLSGIQNIVIIFLALIINIHFGLFLVSSAFFAGVGYLFDPLFESLGYTLLSADALRGLWTSMYNNGVMRLSYFNNTIVVGSFTVALILALPIYFLLNKSILASRQKIVLFLEKHPLLAKLGILKKSDKKDSVFRMVGLGVFAGLSALLAATALLMLDPLVKFTLEKGLSKATGKDALIKSVQTDLGNASLHINDLEIQKEDGKTNNISIEKIVADLDFNALLLRKKHMELMQITGIAFDTPSSNPKRTAAKDEKSKSAVAKTSAFEIPDIKLPTPQNLIKNADLKSVKVYNDARQKIEKIKTKWEHVYKEQLSGDRLEEYKKDLAAIKSATSSKDPTKLLKLKDDIAAFKKKIDSEKTKLTALKKDFLQDKAYVEALIAEVKSAPKEDYKKLKSAYTLDSGGAINIISTIFGERVRHYISIVKKYYTAAAPYMKSEQKPEHLKPPRGEGRWFKFKEKLPSPDIYIAKVDLSGKFKEQDFTGVVHDIADDQKLLGKATSFKITSDGNMIEKLVLSGKDDRLGKEAHESILFSAKKITLNKLALSSLNIEKSAMALEGKVDIYGLSKVDLSSTLHFKNAAISMKGIDEKYAAIINDMLAEIKEFRVRTDAEGSLQSPSVRVDTDLDKKISIALSSLFSKEAKKYKAQLQTMLNEKMQGNLEGLQSTASGIPNINALIGSQNKTLNSLLSQSTSVGSGSATDSIKDLLPF